MQKGSAYVKIIRGENKRPEPEKEDTYGILGYL
jgi:hypothetical protein